MFSNLKHESSVQTAAKMKQITSSEEMPSVVRDIRGKPNLRCFLCYPDKDRDISICKNMIDAGVRACEKRC